MPDTLDISFMKSALALARPGLGRTWPNPSVGAVIVKDGAIIAQGATAEGGRPHAETVALAQAGNAAQGATLYVSLEPCAHQGQTPPCTDAIIAARIGRVVIACIDPNPVVAGKGIMRLREADIEVAEGICAREAAALNEGFFSVILRGRPFVTLKLATSGDEKITGQAGEWITGGMARERVHALRSTQDAILTGIGTVLADDPQLTARIPGGQSPQRILLDGRLRVEEHAKLLPARIFTTAQALAAQPAKVHALRRKGALLFPVTSQPEGLSLPEILRTLAQEGFTRLMVEAGGAVAASFLRERYVDRIYWFRAPEPIGAQGMPAIRGYLHSIAGLPDFTVQATERLGNDTLTVMDRNG